MRIPTLFFLTGFLLLVTLPKGVGDEPSGDHPVSESEVERVRAHIAAAEEALHAADVSDLRPAQRTARAEVLEWLAEYRAAGVFPHNHTHPGQRVPVFVDGHDTPCAVGYLLLRSGETRLVEDVVTGDNNARIHALAGESRLRLWLEERGLTLDEAAMIQPTYCGGGAGWGCPEEPEPTPAEIPRYNPTTLGLAGLTAGAMTWGLSADRSVDGVDWAGWTVLGLGVVDGIQALRGVEHAQDGWAIAVNGLASFGGSIVGFRRLLRRGSDPGPLERRSLAVTPWVPPEGRGLAVRWQH